MGALAERLKAFWAQLVRHPIWGSLLFMWALVWPWFKDVILWYLDKRMGNRAYQWIQDHQPGVGTIIEHWGLINASAFLILLGFLFVQMWRESRPVPESPASLPTALASTAPIVPPLITPKYTLGLLKELGERLLRDRQITVTDINQLNQFEQATDFWDGKVRNLLTLIEAPTPDKDLWDEYFPPHEGTQNAARLTRLNRFITEKLKRLERIIERTA